MNTPFPTAQGAKDQAKRLRAKMTAKGQKIGHAKSLELIAHRYGFRDWNAMSAAIAAAPAPSWAPGDRVTGKYLSQPFRATVVDVALVRPGWVRVGLDLDEAIDVVAFDSFSNHRSRIRGTVGPKGHSAEHTSDGHPQLQLDF
ncbi:glyoxalase superfamily protein [Shimia thalassica]|uniref:glyoxalase superfamily protein n=1 Tax=Shimia thalassica TaxID=1715693 RepID=UPI000C06F7A1|nr:glyoxalase superfamily protein [Shimia thalassica]PHO03586.1 hypothetical protein CSC82_12010 [Rhodobacteraceae bacterium 4F10]MBU2942095.1 hypothetical protein [Shimia thalassica]MDO6482888.1 glyoxalase superfamily protein [Shimia thalassica]MDO6502936.1 glyoxalase superfamily protein [Shimia thalassica]MDO6522471.1 glyoxalase superfamily protein [Shimia thalassica]